MRKAFLFVCCATFFILCCKAQDTPVVIPGSQSFKLSSTIVKGQKYEIQVMLPAGYGKSQKYYPVLYLMD
ncbi:MAG TPA: hypothetical protein VFL47_11945, partial [Flavisolibacter sp.]|nr:hypothetical protein [Flavisolibacter sp.]